MPDSAAATLTDHAATFARLPVSRIAPDINQPRRSFDEAALAELAASIAEHGIIQPIIVRPKLAFTSMGEGDYDYMIVAGERRWRASKLAGLIDIPAIIRADLTADTVSVLQLIENLQRKDLTLWETAIGCANLVEAIGLDAAAQRLGYSKPWVSQRANVIKLREDIRDLIRDGLLTDVETAHNLEALSDLDEDGNAEAGQMIEWIINGAPPTREHVRELLKDARAEVKAEARREALYQQREAEARAAAAARDPLTLTPPDEDGDETPSQPAAAKAKPRPAEDQYQRERRLREEAWTELAPDCRKLAREARRVILDTLTNCLGEALPKAFELTVGQPLTSRQAPAKATGGLYLLDIRGTTDDAGVLIEALAPEQKVALSTMVTIAQLRQVEALLGQRFPVRCPGTGSMGQEVHGTKLVNAASLISKAHQALQPVTEDPSQSQDPNPGLAVIGIVKFLDGCTQRDPQSRTKAADLYAGYRAWCDRHQLVPVPLNDSRWGATIKDQGISKVRSNGWQYCGIKLLIEADQ